MLKNDVNTPQAVVNIDVLDLNIKRMNDVVKQYGVKLRPHIKTHRTPAIAHRQLAAGASLLQSLVKQKRWQPAK